VSVRTAPRPELSTGRQGNYAGAASRAVAFGTDVGASWGLYTLGAAAISLFSQLVFGHSIKLSSHATAAAAVLAAWDFLYFAVQWALGGKTLGMAIFGVRVVRSDGNPINPRAAVIRTLILPISIAVFGLGFLGILTNRERKAWHDRVAGTAVVYDWDARAARLRWLAHHEAQSGPGHNGRQRDASPPARDGVAPAPGEPSPI
jgi:uncharacterized RDD family membrane protein YckC